MSPFMTQVEAGELDVDKLLSHLSVNEKVSLLAGMWLQPLQTHLITG